MNYIINIGLEIHIRLKLNNKAFCACSNLTKQICNFCIGMPGSLPIINFEMIENGFKLASALNCNLNSEIVFQRKQYDFWDMAKMYQITLEEKPIGIDGWLYIFSQKVGIQRISVEEDAAKTIYDQNDIIVEDFKAGQPLIELTTYPDIHNVETAIDFLKFLHLLVLNLDLIDDKSSNALRCDANISLNENPRVELKNLNSLTSIRKALEFEISRQTNLLNSSIFWDKEETRSWSEEQNITLFSRKKENFAQYRFQPEFDIPVIDCSHLTNIKILNPLNIMYMSKISDNYYKFDNDRKIKFIDLIFKGSNELILFLSKLENNFEIWIDLLSFDEYRALDIKNCTIIVDCLLSNKINFDILKIIKSNINNDNCLDLLLENYIRDPSKEMIVCIINDLDKNKLNLKDIVKIVIKTIKKLGCFYKINYDYITNIVNETLNNEL